MNDQQEYIRSLLASLEEVTADAECMAEAWDKQSHSTYTKYSKRICTCPACVVARKYRRARNEYN